MFCSADFYFPSQTRHIIQNGINLSAHAFQADALFWNSCDSGFASALTLVPGLLAGRGGHSPGDMPMPSGLSHLHWKKMCLLFGIFATTILQKHNATTLLRWYSMAESVVGFNACLKYLFTLVFGCTESLLCHVGSSSWLDYTYRTRPLFLYFKLFFILGQSFSA